MYLLVVYFNSRHSIRNLISDKELTYINSVIIGIGIVLFDCLISVTVEDLGVMLSLVGGVTCPIIVYIIPSL